MTKVKFLLMARMGGDKKKADCTYTVQSTDAWKEN